MLEVIPILALKDNYIWAIVNNATGYCAVVDPGDAQPVIQFLQSHSLALAAILITHHHWDHTNGIAVLREQFAVPIYGPAHEDQYGFDYKLTEGDSVHLDKLGVDLKIYDIPGHTKGHITYFGHGWLFTGDTLFSAGCGRLFEGTAAQMAASLAKIASLPESTFIYCGHEYSAANLQFAETVEPQNKDITVRKADVAKLRADNRPTLPSTLELEKRINPFLRCHVDSVIASVQEHTTTKSREPVQIFQALRSWKDTF